MAMEMTYSCAHGDPGENRSRPYDLLLGPEAGEVHGYCLVFAAILPHLFDLRRSIKLAVAMLETERVSSGAGRIGSNSGVRDPAGCARVFIGPAGRQRPQSTPEAEQIDDGSGPRATHLLFSVATANSDPRGKNLFFDRNRKSSKVFCVFLIGSLVF